ncbi:MAG: tetratricopeptide repeat protein [Desulfobacca sp.]|uniref:tetratricopeptide repeat protein n=1 Tax=Desulfobacca sp. TaxID=2067990 RepID=UPI00404ACC58
MPFSLLVVLFLALLLTGCGGRQVVEVEEMPTHKITAPATSAAEKTSSKSELATLQELVGRNVIRPEEATQLSSRLLQEEIAPVLDEQTLNNLEKVLLTALSQSDKQSQANIQRDLGIANYYNKKYHKARQALQSANESNPRDPRTHYYLARIFQQLGKMEEAKGNKTMAERHRKRAQIEIETARKLAPGNTTYQNNFLESSRQQ